MGYGLQGVGFACKGAKESKSLGDWDGELFCLV
jgi:hypothetical protein